jgi:hypothetical protein
MSITTKLATASLALLALGAVVALGSGQAVANTKGPTTHNPPGPPGAGQHPAGGAATHPNRGHYDPFKYSREHLKCYWLPTVSNGSISGLEQKCIWK